MKNDLFALNFSVAAKWKILFKTAHFAWTNFINLHVIFLHVAWYYLHEQSKINVAVVAAGVSQVKAAAVVTAVAALNAPTPVEAADAVAARIWTSPSLSVHVLTIRAANAVRKSHRKANVSGLVCGLAAANVTRLSSNSHQSSPNRCAIAHTAMDAAAEKRAQVSWHLSC